MLGQCKQYYTKMIPTLLFILVINTYALNPFGPTIAYDFVNCISELIENNFIKPGLLVFADTYSSSHLVSRIRADTLKRIHETDKYLVQVARSDNKSICGENQRNKENLFHVDPFKAVQTAEYFVIIIDTYKDFSNVASKIVQSRYWNPFAKFIIFFIECYKSDNQMYIEKMLSCLFNYNVMNVIVGVPHEKHLRTVTIYSWRPYDPPKYCGYSNETANNRASIENTCERGILQSKGDMFDGKLPLNMHKCVLYILALERQPFISRNREDPSIERVLINDLFRNYNFSVHYKYLNSFRGERDEKGKWGGALKELVAKRGQILLGGIFPDFDVHEDFEYSSTYLSDFYTWIVPRAHPSPPWTSLSIAFTKNVWYSVIACFIICVLTWKLIGELSEDSSYNRTFGHCMINTWISMLGFCCYIRPVSKSLRVFFVFFNIYCILFVTAYQTKLINILQNPKYDNQIDTVEELVESELKFGGTEELHDLFYNSSDQFDYEIGEQWIDINNISRALKDVVIHRNFSVLCSRLELSYLTAVTPELNDELGNDNYFSFERKMFVVPLELIALRGFPFMKRFSRKLNLYRQLGINERVRRNYAAMNIRKRAKLLFTLNHQPNHFKALSMQHLQGGFCALGFGMIIGVIVLLFEILSNTKYVEILYK